MNIKSQIFTIVFLADVVCSNAQPTKIRLSVMQGKNEYKITQDNQTIKLAKHKFKLVFNSFMYTDKKSYAAQIGTFISPKAAAMIHVGMKIDSIPYFAGGTGLASDVGKEYECMYIDTEFDAHHYIMYGEKDSDRRAALEGRNGDTLRLSWDIKKYAVDPKKEKRIKKLDTKCLYLIVLNDFNLDGIVEEGEYAVVKIEFEDK
jgi:hypothetical protein